MTPKPPRLKPTNTPHRTNTTTAAPGFLSSILDKIPLPRWAIYTIFAAIILLMLICVVCCCVKCCCKGKKKKKKMDQTINMEGMTGSTTTALVQPGAEDAEGRSANQQRGKLEYSLEFNAPKSELTVGIKEAADLKAMDLGGTSDPYVKVYILPSKSKTFETKVFRKTLNPVFNEIFKYQIPQKDLVESTLVMQVYDFNRFSKHDIIGEIRLDLSTVDWNHVIEEWRDLSEASKHGQEHLGDICFSLRYVPTNGKLTVIILEAKNLKPMDQGGSSDPYVKVQLILDRKKWKKKRTSVKKQTVNPYFNESFTFDVSFEQIQKVQLVISVWDHDKISRNDAIGKIYLGCSATGNQLRHWADMLSNPRKPVAQWHTLLSSEQVDTTLALKHPLKFPLRNKVF
ncbi:synaptotagmin VIII isoform X1 [Misgurnus anguillicaudatus]|uniref:synaptotagmin VIII isoform X1 n=1 Tax=Misgurnus anguillicaudatus TaxID=75329 RepID=UPI002435A74B|nr:synaptotagmin VIII isoform X1 [Misgurnus anguillicaudatus]XP_055049272.1 synaptotagmin VIII isoform X1 [Misgurnus anguillicaudatus]XP_055049273.1 synaptotagmin VIII isoform X1 [Misgurnus anguillicaudatus]